MWPAVLRVLCLAASMFLLAAPPAQSQGTQPASPQPGMAGPAIQGRVVDASGHSYISGAMVMLHDFSGASRQTTISDREGRFVFYDLRPGKFEISVSHPEYEQQSVDVVYDGRPDPGLRIPLKSKNKPNPTAPGAYVASWALQIPAEAREEFNKGLKDLKDGRMKESGERFSRAIEVYPKYAAAHSAMGTVHMSLGDKPAAAAAFEKALEIDANLADACLGLGSLYTAEGRYEEAEKLLLRARMLKSDDWRVLMTLAELYMKANMLEKAEAPLRRVLELEKNSPRPYLLLINSLAPQDKLPETLAAMEEYLRRFPNDRFAEQVRAKRDRLKAQLEQKSAEKPE